MNTSDEAVGPHLLPPDGEGFRGWPTAGLGAFAALFRGLRCRIEGDVTRVRVDVAHAESNPLAGVHGGFILAFIEQAMFCGPAFAGRLAPAGSLTVATSTQFIGGASLDEPLDALVEVVGETGRMMFVRGLLVQGERRVVSFEGTLRKLGKPRPA